MHPVVYKWVCVLDSDAMLLALDVSLSGRYTDSMYKRRWPARSILRRQLGRRWTD